MDLVTKRISNIINFPMECSNIIVEYADCNDTFSDLKLVIQFNEFFGQENIANMEQKGLINTAEKFLNKGITINQYLLIPDLVNGKLDYLFDNDVFYTTSNGDIRIINPRTVAKYILYHDNKMDIYVNSKKLKSYIYINNNNRINLPVFIINDSFHQSYSKGMYERMSDGELDKLEPLL